MASETPKLSRSQYCEASPTDSEDRTIPGSIILDHRPESLQSTIPDFASVQSEA